MADIEEVSPQKFVWIFFYDGTAILLLLLLGGIAQGVQSIITISDLLCFPI
jgi:hypothetical protein